MALHLAARLFIETAKRKRNLGQEELHMLSFAHLSRGDEAEALETLHRAAELKGPLDQVIREQLAALEVRRRDGGADARGADRKSREP